ncbi:uncharacterized protein LOC144354127 [Saccoglossus kowalevskii]
MLGKCYFVSQESVGWTDALSSCQKQGGHLAVIQDKTERKALNVLAKSNKRLWIGLRDLAVDGSPHWVHPKIKYDNNNKKSYPWASDASKRQGHDCVVAVANEDNMFEWQYSDCQNSETFLCASAAVGCNECVTLNTPNSYSYQYITDATGLIRLTFEVKANNDVHIGLSAQQHDLSNMYEIVIGGWGNSQSVIRRSKQGFNQVAVYTPGILSSSEFRGFWLTWQNGKIKVGKAGKVDSFMHWTDPNPLVVSFIGYCTGWGSTGVFSVCTEYYVIPGLGITTPDDIYCYRSYLTDWERG